MVGTWIEGVPAKGMFGINLRGKAALEVSTFRCAGCGYLEAYAL